MGNNGARQREMVMKRQKDSSVALDVPNTARDSRYSLDIFCRIRCHGGLRSKFGCCDIATN